METNSGDGVGRGRRLKSHDSELDGRHQLVRRSGLQLHRVSWSGRSLYVGVHHRRASSSTGVHLPLKVPVVVSQRAQTHPPNEWQTGAGFAHGDRCFFFLVAFQACKDPTTLKYQNSHLIKASKQRANSMIPRVTCWLLTDAQLLPWKSSGETKQKKRVEFVLRRRCCCDAAYVGIFTD